MRRLACRVVLLLAIAQAAAAAAVLESVDFALDPFRKGRFDELDAALDRLTREDAHMDNGSRAPDVAIARIARMLSVDETLVPQLRRWRNTSKHRPWAELATAEYEIALAFQARGGRYAEFVDARAWPIFHARLDAAEAALNRSLAIKPDAREPRAARVQLALFRQLGEAELVSRFKEAVRLDPVSPEAHDAMFLALLPKWLGDKDLRMLFTFARDASRKNPEDPYVALLIVRAHKELIGSDLSKEVRYYRKPEVWAEVSAAMGTFLRAYPDSIYGHNLFGRLALVGGQREILRRELAWIGEAPPSLAVWSDIAEFDRAKRWAALDSPAQHASPLPASQVP